MKYWNVVFATLVIFGCGVVTGGLVVSMAQRNNPEPAHAYTLPEANAVERSYVPEARTPDAGRVNLEWVARSRMEFLERMAVELDLTDKQKQMIGQSIGERQKRVKEITDEMTPKIREELQLAGEDFRSQLTPPQRRRFEQMHRKRLVQRKSGGAVRRNKGQAPTKTRPPFRPQ